jgi:hypothetical protein
VSGQIHQSLQLISTNLQSWLEERTTDGWKLLPLLILYGKAIEIGEKDIQSRAKI